jgi:spermidine synthase
MSIFSGVLPPEVIFETSSQYNNNIKVLKSGDVIKLSVDNFIQSLSKNSKNAARLCWGETVNILKSQETTPKNILILGLGGGTMQHFIRDAYPEAKMVSVEIDPVMVEIARKYFDLDSIGNHQVVVDDAFRFVVEPEQHGINKQSFDVVIVDTVLGDNFPDLASSGNFLSSVKALALPGSLIIFNRMYLEDYQPKVNGFMGLLEDFFSDIQTKIVAGYTNSDNILIYGRT